MIDGELSVPLICAFNASNAPMKGAMMPQYSDLMTQWPARLSLASSAALLKSFHPFAVAAFVGACLYWAPNLTTETHLLSPSLSS